MTFSPELFDGKRVAVVGSRAFSEPETVMNFLVKYCMGAACIVSGGARGVDSWAEYFANRSKIPLSVYPAEWDVYGKSAGYRRNEVIVNHADIVVAFWDGISRGTKHTMDLATKYNRQLYVIQPAKPRG